MEHIGRDDGAVTVIVNLVLNVCEGNECRDDSDEDRPSMPE